MGRFINADVYAATGQGLLGNNMFAYCANNPVKLADNTGMRFQSVVNCINDVGSQGPRYILSQSAEPYGSKAYGLSTISHGGCGPVATYNAMQMLGRYNVTLDDVISSFKSNNGLILHGFLGTSPYAVVDYFQRQNYTAFATTDVAAYETLSKTADACILWYLFPSDEFPYVGAHFVAFKQQEDVGTYYNLYAGSVRPTFFSGGPHSFLSSRNRFMPIMILIYGH